MMLQICPPHLPLYLGKSKEVISIVLFIRNFDYLCYLRRKQTVIHLPTPKPASSLAALSRVARVPYKPGGNCGPGGK